MGNCIKKESAMEWAGEDWGSSASETLFPGDITNERFYEKATDVTEEDRLDVENEKGVEASALSVSGGGIITAVKIKITKKQLEELLSRMDGKGLSAEDVVAQLMRANDQFETHQRPWRPALQSIPELN